MCLGAVYRVLILAIAAQSSGLAEPAILRLHAYDCLW
jgi:hypothetical protein